MKRFALILCFALVASIGCDRRDDEAGRDATDGARPDAATGTAADERSEPAGVPRPVDTFGAVAVDVDRIVLTERTPIPGSSPDGQSAADSGANSGEAAHPAVWETTDPEWIDDFIAAVGRETSRIERPPTDCRPWADLTLYRDQAVTASFAVECPRDTLTTFRTRPPTHVFIARDEDATASLLQSLRDDQRPEADD